MFPSRKKSVNMTYSIKPMDVPMKTWQAETGVHISFFFMAQM